MRSTQVLIFFDNSAVYYSPGERVTGKVILCLTKEKHILGIDMNLIGKCKVSHSCMDPVERRLPGHRRSLRSHSSDKYFIIKDNKSFPRQDENQASIPAGMYEYPFSWTLPKNIPSSFEGPYGWVRYRMEVIVRYSFWDHRCEKEAVLNIAGEYDLSLLDPLLREVHVENKRICFPYQFEFASLELTFELERRAFIPGQTIRFTATTNLTLECNCQRDHSPFKGVSVALIQEQIYKIKDTVRRTTLKLSQVRGPMVFCNLIEVWHGNIELLPVPPTMLGSGSRLIDINYYLKVSVGEAATCITFNIKLQIGTIPWTERRRPFSGSDSPRSQVSIELPLTPTTSRSPERASSGGIEGQFSDITRPRMDLLSVITPGPSSRRASAPPIWLEAVTENIPDDEANRDVAGACAISESESPPPCYSDAVFFGSVGFIETLNSPRISNGTECNDRDGPPPEYLDSVYARQPPFFLRKGAKHLFDDFNVYSTL